jgi:FtsZ-interacting cell division protein ZipA
MSELRWTLLVLWAGFIVGLAWLERRRGHQAAGSGAARHAAAREPPAELPPQGQTRREPTLNLPMLRALDPVIGSDLPVLEAATRPPPERAGEDAATAAAADTAAAAALGPLTQEAVLAGVALESLPRLPPAPAPRVEWPPDERRRIVALRLVATQPERFAGRLLRQALAAEGFVLGRFAIFHKPDDEQRAVLSAASLNTPGTFDEETMDSQHYGGLSLFAVLPGPKTPPETFDELVLTARSLSDRLQGALQDEQGTPLTPARIALLRERLAVGAGA